MPKRISDFVYARRYHVLVLTAVITIVCIVAAALRIQMDQSIEIWFLRSDPDIVRYHEFLDIFGGEDTIVIGVSDSRSIFRPEVLQAIERITRAAEKLRGVHRARSISNLAVPRNIDDSLFFGALFERAPESLDGASAVEKEVRASPSLLGRLVSNDGLATTIVVDLRGSDGKIERKAAVINALQEIVASERASGAVFHLAGLPLLEHAMNLHATKDNTFVIPAMLAIITTVSWFMFRHWRLWLVPIMLVTAVTAWVLGTMALVGWKANILTTVLIALVPALAVLDSMHLLSAYCHELRRGSRPKHAVDEAVKQLFRPCLYTAVTTLTGFLALCATDLVPLNETGMMAIFGVCYAFVLTFSFLTAWLYVMEPPPADRVGRSDGDVMGRALEWLARPTMQRSVVIVVGAVVVTACAGMYVFRVEVGSNPRGYLRKGDPYRADFEAVEQLLGGSVALEFLVTAGGDHGLQDPRALARLDEFQQWLVSLPGVSADVSPVQVVKDFRRVVEGGEPRHYRLPETVGGVAEFYVIAGGNPDFRQILADDHTGRISARMTMPDRNGRSVLDAIENKAKELFPDADLRIDLTGQAKLLSKMDQYLVSSQVNGMITAFLLVFLIIFLAFRSIRLTALALIPNVMPLILVLGFMGLTGMGLEGGTVMIAVATLPISVDDTIHFLDRLREARQQGLPLEEAIAQAMKLSGRAIIASAIILTLALATQLNAEFQAIINAGILGSLETMLALCADLLVLPAVIKIWKPKI